jgi:cytochrome c oxidase subunit 3
MSRTGSGPVTLPPRTTHKDKDNERNPGGRGPTPPHHRGYGDDDWKNNPPGRRGPRERLKRFRVGVACALISIFIVFVGFTSAYVVTKGGFTTDEHTGATIRTWKSLDVPQILWLNTVLLLVSSVTIEMARQRAFQEPQVTEEWLGLAPPSRRASLPWLGLTLILGFGFLVGQYIAWRQLNAQGIFMASNPSSSFFFILTGAHALHLVGGICVLAWAAMANLLSRRLESRQIATDSGAWYWHAMGVLWVYIFALFLFVK